jgi:hypothetical protein
MTLTDQWAKSTYCNEPSACIEARLQTPGVALRDSKDPTIPGFAVTPGAWNAFVTGIPKK